MIFAAKVEAESRLVGVSPAIRDVNAIIAKIATSDCCVLIEGESGTGKELVARRIHMLSSRAGRPFLPVNCAGVSEGLFESQFFGHVRGAFTGAEQTMRGLVRTADGGTLFLDEIGDMPLSLQPKFLRVLQEGEVLPVGQSLPVAVNTRFVAATNRSLRQMVREEAFREDLFYRLNVVWIHVPPLRERPDDIPPLVEHFNAWFATKYCKEPVQLSHAVCQRLSAYSWPGNVRELSSWFERLYALDARPESMVGAADGRAGRAAAWPGRPCDSGRRPAMDHSPCTRSNRIESAGSQSVADSSQHTRQKDQAVRSGWRDAARAGKGLLETAIALSPPIRSAAPADRDLKHVTE